MGDNYVLTLALYILLNILYDIILYDKMVHNLIEQ